MRTSENLRSAEVHEALGFVSELGGQSQTSGNLAPVVAERLCAVLRARVCLIGQIPTALGDVKMPWRPLAEFGWRDDRQRHAIMSSLDDPAAHDPTVVELLKHDGDFRTNSRRELVDDEGWYASRYYTGFRIESGLDDQVFSVWSGLPRRGWMGIIGLHRAATDPPFEPHTVTLFELLHRQLAPILWQSDTATPAPVPGLQPVATLIPSPANISNDSSDNIAPRRGLTPAQLRVLPYLLQGHREEKIAELLCRSRHTIHDHVMAIYREYGVHNRVGLILRFGGDAAQVPETTE